MFAMLQVSKNHSNVLQYASVLYPVSLCNQFHQLNQGFDHLRLHLLVNLKEGLVEVVLIPGLGLRLEFGKLAVTLVLLLLNQEVPISLEATTAIVSGLHLRDLLVCKLFFGLFTLLSHNISHRTPVFLGLF